MHQFLSLTMGVKPGFWPKLTLLEPFGTEWAAMVRWQVSDPPPDYAALYPEVDQMLSALWTPGVPAGRQEVPPPLAEESAEEGSEVKPKTLNLQAQNSEPSSLKP